MDDAEAAVIRRCQAGEKEAFGHPWLRRPANRVICALIFPARRLSSAMGGSPQDSPKL
jgi:hypothetical protein